MLLTRFFITLLSVILVTPLFAEDPSFQSDFSKPADLDQWFATQSERWTITDGVLHLTKGEKQYNPPYRSPFSILLLTKHVYGDFELTAKVKTLQSSRGHRDMCVFFGWQDDSRFYYVHLGEKVDPHSSQIFIVNKKPRTAITKTNGEGIPWKDDTLHNVKVIRKAEIGLIEVYFDDMTKPVKTASDKTLSWGLIGLGSFDDCGMWDDVRINGKLLADKTPILPTQDRKGKTIQK